jgi:glycosyltransferase involved in cell wall biosynthesis
MSGPLDGLTLLRYAHIYRDRTSGGIEQYLRHLNEGLLSRNRMRILQMHLVAGAGQSRNPRTDSCGLGQITWLPVSIEQTSRSPLSLARRVRRVILEGAPKEGQKRLLEPGRFITTGRRLLANSCGHLRYSMMILSETINHRLLEDRVDLLAFHWLSYDAGSLISDAESKSVPFVFINHFDNRRFDLPSFRRWMSRFAGLGGVSGLEVPVGLRQRYKCLSDAVDTKFFCIEKARPVVRPREFLLLLPARILEGKGHDDLLLATRSLLQAGIGIHLAFAGAVDSEPFAKQLHSKITSLGLHERVHFLGQLTSEMLRDWYAASDVVVLPSRSEGLGRVLLEAQAMSVPVVAYNTGGIPEAIINGETGFLVERGDINNLAERIKNLLLNAELRKDMGTSGRNFVLDRFSDDALVRRHEDFYLAALSRPKKG